MGQKNYSELFELLERTLHEFILEVNKQKLHNMATNEWSVKDELCHIVFWHRYYPQNYSALAKGEEPVVFTSSGGSTRNQDGVNSLRAKFKDELLTMLLDAQKELYMYIVDKKVAEMNYTNRKRYKTEEFTDQITRHILGHTKLVKKAKELEK